MSRDFDVVVIGGGHNGLTAAGFLAKRGLKIGVFEKNDQMGGLCAGHEFHSGFWSPGILDETSHLRPGIADGLDLEGSGLKFYDHLPPVFAPERKGQGSGLMLWHDPEQAKQEISSFSKRDAERYFEYRTYLRKIAKVVLKVMDSRPPELESPNVGEMWQLAKTGLNLRMLGKKDMMELLRIAPMASADWLREWFETELLNATLVQPSLIGAYGGPWSPGTNANLILDECLRARMAKGGGRSLVKALTTSLGRRDNVELATGQEVKAIELENGRCAGITLANGERVGAKSIFVAASPKHLFQDLLPAGSVPFRARKRIQDFRSRGSTAKVHLAIDGELRFACRPDEPITYARIGEEIDSVEKAFDAIKYGEYSDQPVIDLYVPSMTESDMAPSGKHVVSMTVSFVPQEHRQGWNEERRQDFTQKAVARLAAFAPGIEEQILGRETLLPPDIEQRFNIPGGHIHHGEHGLDQLASRPSPDCAQYETPIPGLTLCGSGSHPGGGISCAPGALAALGFKDPR